MPQERAGPPKRSVSPIKKRICYFKIWFTDATVCLTWLFLTMFCQHTTPHHPKKTENPNHDNLLFSWEKMPMLNDGSLQDRRLGSAGSALRSLCCYSARLIWSAEASVANSCGCLFAGLGIASCGRFIVSWSIATPNQVRKPWRTSGLENILKVFLAGCTLPPRFEAFITCCPSNYFTHLSSLSLTHTHAHTHPCCAVNGWLKVMTVESAMAWLGLKKAEAG